MRRGWQVVTGIALAAVVAGGCGSRGGTTSSGAFQVTFVDERTESIGNQCAVRGNAQNLGNVRAQVDLTYEALNASGAVIGTSTASFEVTGFSNFEFRNGQTNNLGQPSSTVFDSSISCSAISNFRRTQTNIREA
jgi:hypothetical protein